MTVQFNPVTQVTNLINWQPKFFPFEKQKCRCLCVVTTFLATLMVLAQCLLVQCLKTSRWSKFFSFVSCYFHDNLIQNVIFASVDPSVAARVFTASTTQTSWMLCTLSMPTNHKQGSLICAIV